MTDISKISIERINDLVDKLNEINTKFDTINSKLNSMKYVVETGSNNNGWYRKWSDGWIEQGGIISTTSADTYYTVNLLKNYSNNNYIINTTILNKNTNAMFCCVNNTSQEITISSFTIRTTNKASAAGKPIQTYWYTCGY